MTFGIPCYAALIDFMAGFLLLGVEALLREATS